MSYNLGLKGKIKSEKLDLTPPDEILKSLCDEIREETDGEIEGVVLPYGGRMKSYTRKGGMLGYTQDVMPDVFYFPLGGDKGAVIIKIHALECVFYKISGGEL